MILETGSMGTYLESEPIGTNEQLGQESIDKARQRRAVVHQNKEL
jgi:hypothetical protein